MLANFVITGARYAAYGAGVAFLRAEFNDHNRKEAMKKSAIIGVAIAAIQFLVNVQAAKYAFVGTLAGAAFSVFINERSMTSRDFDKMRVIGLAAGAVASVILFGF